MNRRSFLKSVAALPIVVKAGLLDLRGTAVDAIRQVEEPTVQETQPHQHQPDDIFRFSCLHINITFPEPYIFGAPVKAAWLNSSTEVDIVAKANREMLNFLSDALDSQGPQRVEFSRPTSTISGGFRLVSYALSDYMSAITDDDLAKGKIFVAASFISDGKGAKYEHPRRSKRLT